MLAPLGFLFLQGKAGASRNAYKGGTRAMLRELARLLRELARLLRELARLLRELARLLREQGEALKRIG